MMEIWRIAYRSVQSQDWKPMTNKIYFTKGMATGVLKRNEGLTNEHWDDREKMWVSPSGRLVYRIQNAIVDWKNYELL
jgi:hypothetical protein